MINGLQYNNTILPGFIDFSFTSLKLFDLSKDNKTNDKYFNKFICICPICVSSLINPTRPNTCYHFYCYSCLFIWSKSKNSCHYCRTKFEYITKI